MKKPFNPFLINGYISPNYFCDRDEESKTLTEALLNGRNVVLYSPRRMGKTGLLHHLLYQLNKQKVNCIYIDVYATQNLAEFVTELAGAITKNIIQQKKKTFTAYIQSIFKTIKPIIKFDQFNGNPVLELGLSSEDTVKATLSELLEYLDEQKLPTVIAIDEFQQISTYPNPNVEALLRSKIQHLNNTHFVFSGSHQDMLLSMFGNKARPFYQSAQIIYLDKIKTQDYSKFIVKHFKKNEKTITDKAIQSILELSDRHTYYTQQLCNRLYASGLKKINEQDVMHITDGILKEMEPIFFSYRSLLTKHQWKTLRAIAREDRVYSPNSKDFVQGNQLGATSSVRRSIESLHKSDMIFKKLDEYIALYDVFLKLWLKYK